MRPSPSRLRSSPSLVLAVALYAVLQFALIALAVNAPAGQAADQAARHTAVAVLGLGAAFVFLLTIWLLWRRSRASERNQRWMGKLIDQIGVGVCLIDEHNCVTAANRAAAELFGLPRARLTGEALSALLLRNGELNTTRTGRTVETLEGRLAGANSNQRVVTLLDVTDRHRNTEFLRHLVHHDALTGLPNRLFLSAHLKRALQRIDRNGRKLGVAMIDLDGFKPVNDSLGHAAGDALLRAVAQRLQSVLRGSDIVARTGGDEFVGVFEDLQARADLPAVGERLLEAFAHPFELDGNTVSIGASIGLALAPDDGHEPDRVLTAADAAMYAAKQTGKRSFRLASGLEPNRPPCPQGGAQ